MKIFIKFIKVSRGPHVALPGDSGAIPPPPSNPPPFAASGGRRRWRPACGGGPRLRRSRRARFPSPLLSSPPLLSNSMPGSPTPSSLAAAGRRRLPGTRSGDGVTGSGWPLGGSALAWAVAAGPTPWPRWSLRRRRRACGAAVPRVAGCRSGAPPLAPAWPAGGPPSPPPLGPAWPAGAAS